MSAPHVAETPDLPEPVPSPDLPDPAPSPDPSPSPQPPPGTPDPGPNAMSEHLASDDPGGDDSGFPDAATYEEHPLEGGQGEAVDDAQEENTDGQRGRSDQPEAGR